MMVLKPWWSPCHSLSEQTKMMTSDNNDILEFITQYTVKKWHMIFEPRTDSFYHNTVVCQCRVDVSSRQLFPASTRQYGEWPSGGGSTVRRCEVEYHLLFGVRCLNYSRKTLILATRMHERTGIITINQSINQSVYQSIKCNDIAPYLSYGTVRK